MGFVSIERGGLIFDNRLIALYDVIRTVKRVADRVVVTRNAFAVDSGDGGCTRHSAAVTMFLPENNEWACHSGFQFYTLIMYFELFGNSFLPGGHRFLLIGIQCRIVFDSADNFSL